MRCLLRIRWVPSSSQTACYLHDGNVVSLSQIYFPGAVFAYFGCRGIDRWSFLSLDVVLRSLSTLSPPHSVHGVVENFRTCQPACEIDLRYRHGMYFVNWTSHAAQIWHCHVGLTSVDCDCPGG